MTAAWLALVPLAGAAETKATWNVPATTPNWLDTGFVLKARKPSI